MSKRRKKSGGNPATSGRVFGGERKARRYSAPVMLDMGEGEEMKFDLFTSLYNLGSGEVLVRTGREEDELVLAALAMEVMDHMGTPPELTAHTPQDVIDLARRAVRAGLLVPDGDGRAYLAPPTA